MTLYRLCPNWCSMCVHHTAGKLESHSVRQCEDRVGIGANIQLIAIFSVSMVRLTAKVHVFLSLEVSVTPCMAKRPS